MDINKKHAQKARNLTLKVGRKVSYIAVHYTATDASAENNCRYFSSGNRNASADYFIDKDGGIWQFNADPRNYCSWHCGDGRGKYGISNANSIGIEVVSSGAEFTQEQKDALRELTAHLMAEFGVKAENVVRHYDASRKACPAPYCGSAKKDKKWKELRAYITSGKATQVQEPAKASLTVDGLWGKDTTKALQRVLGTTVDGIVSNQYASYKASNPGLLPTSWEWENNPGKNGSAMVKALQRRIGATADGYIGPKTIRQLQRYLGTTEDGCVSKPSQMVKVLQRKLNAGTF